MELQDRKYAHISSVMNELWNGRSHRQADRKWRRSLSGARRPSGRRVCARPHEGGVVTSDSSARVVSGDRSMRPLESVEARRVVVKLRIRAAADEFSSG